MLKLEARHHDEIPFSYSRSYRDSIMTLVTLFFTRLRAPWGQWLCLLFLCTSSMVGVQQMGTEWMNDGLSENRIWLEGGREGLKGIPCRLWAAQHSSIASALKSKDYTQLQAYLTFLLYFCWPKLINFKIFCPWLPLKRKGKKMPDCPQNLKSYQIV